VFATPTRRHHGRAERVNDWRHPRYATALTFAICGSDTPSHYEATDPRRSSSAASCCAQPPEEVASWTALIEAIPRCSRDRASDEARPPAPGRAARSSRPSRRRLANRWRRPRHRRLRLPWPHCAACPDSCSTRDREAAIARAGRCPPAPAADPIVKVPADEDVTNPPAMPLFSTRDAATTCASSRRPGSAPP